MSAAAKQVACRVRAWLGMSAEERKVAVRCMIWGYDDEKLRDNELVEIVTGQHGYILAQAFIETLSEGSSLPSGGPSMSTAARCLQHNRLDVLERLVSTPTPVIAGASPLSPSAWLDRLCTRTTTEGRVVRWTMFEMARDSFSLDVARRAFEFAFKHQPDHPNINEILSSGKGNASILMELMLRDRITELSPIADDSTEPAMARRNRMV